MNTPNGITVKTTYENFVAQCPHCDYENVFNRATDLQTLEAIDFMQVVCLNADCRLPFNINGDSISPVHTYLIFDCYELKKDKKYMYCILNLAQAYEAFFGLFLRVELLYKPFAQSNNRDLELLNQLTDALNRQIRSYTYHPLRNIFLNFIINGIAVSSIQDAEGAIDSLRGLRADPPNSAINSVSNEKLRSLLSELKASRIGEVRNQVVHKRAYRPTLDEIDNFIRETRNILFVLDDEIGPLMDNVMHYY